MYKGKLYEELNAAEKRIQSILIGAFCFGDDGENAEITQFWTDRNGIPMIHFVQEDGLEFDFPLADYLGSIELEQDEIDEVEDYLESLGLYESKAVPRKRKLVLNEDATAQPAKKVKRGVSLILDEEATEAVKNFVGWSRELLKEVGIPIADPKAERVYIKEGSIYYQGPYLGFKPGKAKMLQARLQKYVNREKFPAGMTISPERGMFIAPFEADGEIKLV